MKSTRQRPMTLHEDSASMEAFLDGPKPIMEITAQEFERADFDEALGAGGIEVTHGVLGKLCQAI